MYSKTYLSNKTERGEEKWSKGKNREKKRDIRPVLSDLKGVHDIFWYISTTPR